MGRRGLYSAPKRSFGRALAAASVALCLGFLAACTASTHAEQPAAPAPKTAALAGDSALPELAGAYSYLLAKVVSKDAEADSVRVEAVAWDDERPFGKSGIAAGMAGDVSCSELVFFPAGINEGSTVVVAFLASDGDAFPLTACSIEKLDLFEERVDRWAFT